MHAPAREEPAHRLTRQALRVSSSVTNAPEQQGPARLPPTYFPLSHRLSPKKPEPVLKPHQPQLLHLCLVRAPGSGRPTRVIGINCPRIHSQPTQPLIPTGRRASSRGARSIFFFFTAIPRTITGVGRSKTAALPQQSFSGLPAVWAGGSLQKGGLDHNWILTGQGRSMGRRPPAPGPATRLTLSSENPRPACPPPGVPGPTSRAVPVRFYPKPTSLNGHAPGRASAAHLPAASEAYTFRYAQLPEHRRNDSPSFPSDRTRRGQYFTSTTFVRLAARNRQPNPATKPCSPRSLHAQTCPPSRARTRVPFYGLKNPPLFRFA